MLSDARYCQELVQKRRAGLQRRRRPFGSLSGQVLAAPLRRHTAPLALHKKLIAAVIKRMVTITTLKDVHQLEDASFIRRLS